MAVPTVASRVVQTVEALAASTVGATARWMAASTVAQRAEYLDKPSVGWMAAWTVAETAASKEQRRAVDSAGL